MITVHIMKKMINDYSNSLDECVSDYDLSISALSHVFSYA